MTYHLATDVGPLTEAPRGGAYTYDNMHYTPAGCRLVVEHLRPVLRRIVTGEAATGALPEHAPRGKSTS